MGVVGTWQNLKLEVVIPQGAVLQVEEADLSKDGNLTKAALVAVDLATRAVDQALHNADVITAKANISQEVTAPPPSSLQAHTSCS